MLYESNLSAIIIFSIFVAIVLGISFWLGRKAQSAKGYYAAHGQIGWFVNGVAFAGDYLSAASFLGICGMIAFYGFDGFLYSIGYLAGWIVALFVIAEPIKRLGKFTFADALDSQFHSRGIKLAVAISTLVVSTFYLIPQMVGAGSLITPLLGLKYHWGVLLVGVTVTMIVVTAGMVSTTWVQFIKGSLLVIFCLILTVGILNRGFTTSGKALRRNVSVMAMKPLKLEPTTDPKFCRITEVDGKVRIWHIENEIASSKDIIVSECQAITTTVDKKKLINYQLQSKDNDLIPVGTIDKLPQDSTDPNSTGPLSPTSFLSTLQNSTVVTWKSVKITEPDKSVSDVYYPVLKSGADLLTPGGSPTFAGVRSKILTKKLDFLSLMLALFCGTASLPHILIRYYTVKDQAAARKSTIVGIATIGLFYILTLYLGLGAMTSGAMDPTNQNMAAPLLAKTFGNTIFAIISAIAFTTVLGTVSGLIMAGSGAVAHDLLENYFRIPMNDHQKVFYGKCAAGVIGVIAMALGIAFEKMNPTFLVGWAFNVAASANLPSLVMLLFWKRTTKQGITTAVIVGLLASLGWILLSQDCYDKVYHIARVAPMPFSQPGLVTIPLGFVVLIIVSLFTTGTAQKRQEEAKRAFPVTIK